MRSLAVARLRIVSVFSRARLPKTGTRRADRNLVISSAVFAMLWIFCIRDLRRLENSRRRGGRNRESPGVVHLVDVGMSSASVKSRLGEPDEMRNDEETRGPSASKWIYRGSRCVVHVFEDKVEFID